MLKKTYKPLFIAVILLLICSLSLAGVSASPPATSQQVFTFASEEVLSASTSYGSTPWGDGNIYPHQKADIFWVIDQTDVNTLSLALQVSPDNTTYFNHSTSSALVTSNVADASSYASANIEGAYYKIVATASNTNAVTLTLKVVLR